MESDGKKYNNHYVKIKQFIEGDRKKAQETKSKTQDYSQHDYSEAYLKVLEKKKLGVKLTQEEEDILNGGKQRASYDDETAHIFESPPIE